MYTVYILKSEQFPKTYVGMTNDMERRLQEHNSGKSTYTKKFLPWKLIHQEVVSTMHEAVKKEKYLKSASGRKFLKQLV